MGSGKGCCPAHGNTKDSTLPQSSNYQHCWVCKMLWHTTVLQLKKPQSLFYRCLVDLQCCANFYCKIIQLYTHIYSFSHPFHYALLQDTEYSCLHYTVWPCCWSNLYMVVCTRWSQTTTPSLSLHTPPSTTITLCLWVWRNLNRWLKMPTAIS